MNGYIKLHRKLVEWGWYSDHAVKDVFLHILMTAYHTEGWYMGTKLEPGQAIISQGRMASELGFSRQQIRTALNKLQSTHEIALDSTNKFTVATVENWAMYQCGETDINQQSTSNQPAINQQSTIEQPTYILYKNNKNNNNIYTMCNSDESHDAKAPSKKVVDELFEQVWKLYPNKKGKGQVSDAKKKKLYEVGYDELVRAIDRYKDELKKDADWRKPQNGSTFFNSGYVDYLDDNYEPQKRTAQGTSDVQDWERRLMEE